MLVTSKFTTNHPRSWPVHVHVHLQIVLRCTKSPAVRGAVPSKHNVTPSSAPHLHTVGTQMSSLLAKLPLDAITRILRFTSAHPRRRNWSEYIDITDILTLCQLCPGLSNLIELLFDTVSTATRIGTDGNGRTLCIPEYHPALPTAKFLQRFSNLRIDLSTRDRRSSNKHLPFQIEHLTAIRTLSIDFLHDAGDTNVGTVLHDILNRIGNRITALHISGTLAAVPDITVLCRCLQEQSMTVKSPVDPKFCVCLGKQLQRVSLDVSQLGHAYARALLNFVGSNCRKILSLQVTNLGYALSETVTTLASSYGNQLRNLKLSLLYIEHARTIIEHCPHACLDIGLGALSLEKEKLFSLLRNNLSGITFDGSIYLHAMTAWPSLRINRLDVQVNDGYFPYASLQELRDCNIRYEGHEPTDFICSLAKATGALENIKLRIGYPKVGAFGELLKANPSIKSVQIACHRQYLYDFQQGQLIVNEPKDIIPTLKDLVYHLATAPNIESIDLRRLNLKQDNEIDNHTQLTRNTLEHIFLKLRYKLVHLVVNETEFLI